MTTAQIAEQLSKPFTRNMKSKDLFIEQRVNLYSLKTGLHVGHEGVNYTNQVDTAEQQAPQTDPTQLTIFA
jgi:hypothetical protein